MSPKSSPAPNTDIKFTSPKNDIWSAYKEVLQKLSEKPTLTDQSQVQTIFKKSATDFRTQLKNSASNLTTTLDSTIDDLTTKLEDAQELLTQVFQAKASQEKTLAEEKEAVTKQRQREKEEYDYEFAKTKKRQQEELDETKTRVLAELKDKQEKFSQKEAELEDLRKQVTDFDKTLISAVKSATDTLEAKLKSDFAHEKALLEATHKGEVSLSTQKISSLENLVKSLQAEIGRLQKAQDQTQSQLSDIAQKAVESTKTIPFPPASTSSKEEK